MKKLLLLVLFLLSINLVYAAEINVKETPVSSVILPGQNAVFDMEVTNTQSSSDDIKVAIMDINWKRQSGNEFYTLSAGQTIKDRLVLFPVGYLNPGVYAINLRFVSTKNPDIYTDKQLVVTIVGYKEAVEASIETNPQGLDPRKENLVKLNLRSKYNINLEDLNVHVENSLFSKDFVLSLNGLEAKTEEFIVKLDENAAEGDYDTKILIKLEDNDLINNIQKLKVEAYSNIKETISTEFKFLIKETTITRVNDGNTESSEVYTLTTSGFKKLFTKFTPDPTNIDDVEEGNKYTWQFDLKPGDFYQIKIYTNYRTPVLIIIILVLLYLFYNKYLKTDLSMHKKILTLKTPDGGIAGVKILLHIKNKGGAVKNLHIIDNIPGVLEVPHEYMTLKPSSIKKGLTGSTIVWEIPELIKSEERVISYKLKSKTGFTGRLFFHKAVCRYKNSMGKLSVARSNEVTVNP